MPIEHHNESCSPANATTRSLELDLLFFYLWNGILAALKLAMK